MSTLQALKDELCAVGAQTEAGFAAGESSPQVARIKALADALEAQNPTPRPADRPALLDGLWRMVYSSFGLDRATNLRRISFGTLPREAQITVSEVFQAVDSNAGRYDNHVAFNAPDGTPGVHITFGRFAFKAGGERRLAITFTGNRIAPAGGVTSDNLRTALGIDPEGALQAPVNFEGWSDVTYLDADLRLMRGNAGNLYVLKKLSTDPPPDLR